MGDDRRPVGRLPGTHELNALTLVFLTSADLVRAWVPGDDFEPAALDDGTVVVLVALHEYLSGDWGACNTCDLCVPVRPLGTTAADGRDGLYLRDPLINRRFNGEVAYWSMGIPRRHGAIDVAHRPDGVSFLVAEGDDVTLDVTVTAPVPAPSRSLVPNRCYAYLEGVPLVAPFDVEFPEPVLDPDSVRIELGPVRWPATSRPSACRAGPTPWPGAPDSTARSTPRTATCPDAGPRRPDRPQRCQTRTQSTCISREGGRGPQPSHRLRYCIVKMSCMGWAVVS